MKSCKFHLNTLLESQLYFSEIFQEFCTFQQFSFFGNALWFLQVFLSVVLLNWKEYSVKNVEKYWGKNLNYIYSLGVLESFFIEELKVGIKSLKNFDIVFVCVWNSNVSLCWSLKMNIFFCMPRDFRAPVALLAHQYILKVFI